MEIAYVICFLLLIIAIWWDERKKSKKNVNVGNIGEGIVSNRLKWLSDDYIVEHDVRYGRVQIDHLVINHKLKICFVIETKMWGGVISGKSGDNRWMQDKNGVIKCLPNPILQNKYHCQIVRKYYDGYSIYNVVVMIRNKNVPKCRSVVGENELIDYIIRTSNKVSNRDRIDSKTEWLSYRVKP